MALPGPLASVRSMLISAFPREKNQTETQNVGFYKLKAGNDYQSVGQSHWLQEVDDLASSPALSLSLSRLHLWLLRRSISGSHRKAHGCGREQSATVLPACC